MIYKIIRGILERMSIITYLSEYLFDFSNIVLAVGKLLFCVLTQSYEELTLYVIINTYKTFPSSF